MPRETRPVEYGPGRSARSATGRAGLRSEHNPSLAGSAHPFGEKLRILKGSSGRGLLFFFASLRQPPRLLTDTALTVQKAGLSGRHSLTKEKQVSKEHRRPFPPTMPRAARNMTMGWSELRAYLGSSFRPEWMGDCEHLRPVVRAELAASDSLDDFYRTCHSYLYDLTAYELSGDKERNHALLHRLVPAPATVLDYGCGIGADGLKLIDRGYEVHFADLCNPSVDYLRWRLRHRGIEAPVYDVDRDTIPRVDVAICWDVLEHVSDPEAVLHRLESLADLVIVNFIQHDVDTDQ